MKGKLWHSQILGLFVLIGANISRKNEGNVIEVTKSGMLALKQSDMVVTFYVTVRHHGEQPVRTMITMVECCEKITEDDTDCDLMELHGGDFGILRPGAEKNLSLLYPNVYGYNRKGVCTVKVLYHCLESSESMDVYHRIEFDTTVSSEVVPQELKGWYDPTTFVPCQSPDQDPFNHCNPVDCNLKYSGHRNYYNQKWKLCQRVPVCLADPEKDLPDVAYVPFSNTCKKLDDDVSEEDLKELSNTEKLDKPVKASMINIRCHHGEIDPKTGLCICDYGWKSQPFDPEAYGSSQSPYSMCDIQCVKDNKFALLPPLLGLLLGFWLSFCVICCEKYDYFFMGYKSDLCMSQNGAYFPLSGDINTSNEFHEDNSRMMGFEVPQRGFVPDFSIPECNMSRRNMSNIS